MCAPTSEVTFTLFSSTKDINVGDPGAVFFDMVKRGAALPTVEVTSALFVIDTRTLQLKHLFRMSPLIPNAAAQCASSALSFTAGLTSLCNLHAVGQLTIGWQPPGSAGTGTSFLLTARFEPSV